MHRHFSSTCKWYLLFVNDNFVEKQILKIVNWIYILLRNNHLSNIFDKMIPIKTLFASAKPLVIANCRGEFQGLTNKKDFSITNDKLCEVLAYDEKTGMSHIWECVS